jgi:hypothetical protein
VGWDTLRPFVEWLGGSAVGQWLGQSEPRVAVLFVVHLVGLTLLLGGTVVVCFRLLGVGFRSGPAAQLAREVAPWWRAGLGLSLLSGALIFTGGAASYFEGQWFRRKMVLLVVALVFQATWFRAVVRAEDGRFSAWQNRVTAAAALLLWFGVGVAGRAIAFF